MSMHYKRITAVAIMTVFAIGLTTCKKENEVKINPPTVIVFEGAITINYNKASVSAEVTDQGGAEVKSKGFVYGVTGESMDTVFCGSGTGVYSAELNNLEPNTTYVYEAFAKNAGGFGTSGKVSFTTKPVPSYTIDVSADPSNGGTTTGGGTFQEGQSCTVKATTNTGFNFVKWTENDVQVSTNMEYTFEVTANRNLVAHFTSQNFTITATVEPDGSGTVSGCDGYNYGDYCTLLATPNSGYAFEKWTENDTQVSTHSEYTFEVTVSRNLVAHFTQQTYTITATAEPAEYGTVSVSGNGVFHYNDQCTLTATVNQGYSFVNWTKNGTQVSTDATWHFAVTESAAYVAHFQIDLTVSANPEVIAKGSSSQLNAIASGGNGSFTYRWTPSTGLNNANIQNPTATPNTTTTYTCTVTSGSQTASGNCIVTVVCSPTNLSATVQNSTNVYLSWTAPNPATSYKVYRDNTLINSNVTTTHYTDNNLSPGTHTYRVSTVYNNVESPKSNEAQVTIAPIGAINGLFSVSATQQVWFSQGNLQYKASTNTWRFAENQWDFVGGTYQGVQYGTVSGSSNNNIGSTYSGWIDLFGWGTSGYNHGAVCYQPWSISQDDASYYAYRSWTFNLYDQTGKGDWGYNRINNGGDTENTWRTLKGEEWYYVFKLRSTPSNNRFAKATVNGVKGVVLFPDDWDKSAYSIINVNSSGSAFSSNIISLSDWMNIFQPFGVVFLPITGTRDGTFYSMSTDGAGGGGAYHSSSVYDQLEVYKLAFYDHALFPNTTGSCYRNRGAAVRLVCPAN